MNAWTSPIAAALALPTLATVAVAAPAETSYGIGVVAGLDTNPLAVTGDGPDGGHGDVRLYGAVLRFLGRGSTFALFADGRAASRIEGSRTSDAGHDSGDLRAGMALAPPLAAGRLVVSAGGRLSAYRGTFTDRATGEAYQASVAPPTDPPTTIAIPDRLDFDGTGTFVNVRWRQGAWSVSTLASLDRTRFVEDYSGSTDLDSLDHRALTLRPGLGVDIGDAVSLGLYVARTDLEYDDRLALDASGAEVPGTTREDELTHWGATVRTVPGRGWKLDLGLAAIGRADTHAGYYDSTSTSGTLAVDRELSRRSQLRLHAALRDVEYDRATVTGDPDDPDLLGTREQRYAARFTRSFGERLGWHIEVGTQHTDSQDPVFAYDRNWIETGVQFGR